MAAAEGYLARQHKRREPRGVVAAWVVQGHWQEQTASLILAAVVAEEAILAVVGLADQES